MHYSGQHSWVAVVVLLGVLAIRVLTSQRRRGARRPGGSAGARGFAAPSAATPGTAPSDGATSTGTDPGWFTDPFVRHEQRYWSGTAWTEHVLDAGTPAVDPPPERPSPG